MKRKSIESSMIRSIGFDFERSILEIEFNSGAIWQYFDFPEFEWDTFKNAELQGKYFNNEILDQYAESQVG